MTISTSLLLSDNAYGTLGSALATGDTALVFTAGHGARFPAVASGQMLSCCILNANNILEEVQITLHTAGSDSATMVRAANGTTAKAWNAGDRIEARVSSDVLKRLQVEALKEITLSTADSGATYTGSISPTGYGLVTGLVYSLKASTSNSGTAPTINLSSLGAVTVLVDGGGALSAGQMPINGLYKYDSTNLILLNPISSITKTPLNINPNWLLDQINEGTAYSVSAATVQGPDGWSGKATGAGTFTMQRVTDPDNADLLALKVSCTVADAAIGATDDYTIFTSVEGYDLAWLNPGLSSAGQISVRFKAKFPAAGTYGVWLQNSAQNRSYLQTLTVPDGNENEYTLTWTLDTTGTWLLTSGVGLYLGIDLASGSNFQTTVGSWQAGNFKCTSGQTNFMTANTNIMYLKRVHLVPGSVALPYAPQDFQRDVAKAQRYFAKTYSQGVAPGTVTNLGVIGAGAFTAGVGPQCFWRFPIEMRAIPSVTGYSNTTGTSGKFVDAAAADQTVTIDLIGTAGARLGIGVGTLTSVTGHAAANARLT